MFRDFGNRLWDFCITEWALPSHYARNNVSWVWCRGGEDDKYSHAFMQETLFYARLVIARKWLRQETPSFAMWMAAINAALPYKRLIFQHRGCPSKFNKLWDKWLESSSTAGADAWHPWVLWLPLSVPSLWSRDWGWSGLPLSLCPGTVLQVGAPHSS